MSSLDGQVAIVTGGSRGIGLATAGALARAGAHVVIAGTTDETVSAAVRQLGPLVRGVRADIRHDDEAKRVFDTAVQEFGGVDILVNNAGVGVFEPVDQLSLEHWHLIVETNLTGAFLCTRHAVPLMRIRGGGWIVNVSSLASTVPFAGGAAYCASKAGLNAFTEALMQEVRQDGIRVATILPGSVRTGFMRRGTKDSNSAHGDDAWKLAPDDVAQAVIDLLHHPGRSLPSRIEIRPSRPPARK